MPVTAPQPVPPCCQRGFTLSEMLLAMLICGVVLLGAAQFFPRLFQQSRQLQQQNLLTQELRQLMLVLEKNLRRAGFCQQSPCAGRGVTVSDQGRCLILRLQERRYPAAAGTALSGGRQTRRTGQRKLRIPLAGRQYRNSARCAALPGNGLGTADGPGHITGGCPAL
ncbi:prepilin-type N-terminal cleavage/methylation domain-containing protein [Tatumella sp. JGM130]|uniref:prepilin-type N-terminal cleavage/methylation domain-containing protein n=1 Tax=Tatumella sp. JGM130 TaxID=2799797 RepID=UPI001BAF8809|nr:prepilin-type N-terminal cleavage/methylation domain-containing protein [Tatumella sp. JGM130]MBS0893549.1 prepilin-type N-terminal cleavage/methylation domain-containing protein [Tatumella sp. JGM130]